MIAGRDAQWRGGRWWPSDGLDLARGAGLLGAMGELTESVVHQVPAASLHTLGCRYALLHKLDADLPARHSQAAALANPLARDKEKAPSKIGRGL